MYSCSRFRSELIERQIRWCYEFNLRYAWGGSGSFWRNVEYQREKYFNCIKDVGVYPGSKVIWVTYKDSNEITTFDLEQKPDMHNWMKEGF